MKKKFKVLNIEHIAIAVKSIDNAKIIFEDVLGMNSLKKELVKPELLSKIIGLKTYIKK